MRPEKSDRLKESIVVQLPLTGRLELKLNGFKKSSITCTFRAHFPSAYLSFSDSLLACLAQKKFLQFCLEGLGVGKGVGEHREEPLTQN